MTTPFATTARAIVVAGVCAAVGCGDVLVEGDYRGTPLISISGTIRVDDSVTPSEAEAVRVALLWANAGQQSEVAQVQSASAFPARYNLDVFTLPPVRAMSELSDRNGLWALARIVLYIDSDGDERLDLGEPIVGASPDQVLAYFTSAEPTALVKGGFESGYQVMHLRDCDDRLLDKSMLQKSPRTDTVDVVLQQGVAQGLTDLDCDQLSDEFCFDLQLQLSADPENEQLQELYQARCEVESEPTFNNESRDPGETGGGTDPDPTPEPEGDPDPCLESPESADCRDGEPDGEGGGAGNNEVCGVVLDSLRAQDVGGERYLNTWWQFSLCLGESDPCAENGIGSPAQITPEYRHCSFERYPARHTDFCRDLHGLNSGEGSTEPIAAEYRALQCESRI